MKHKRKLLYIGQSFPYPPDSGGRIKTLATLRALSSVYDVTAVFVSEEKPHAQSLSHLSRLGIHPKVFYLPSILQPIYRNIGKMIWNYTHGVPYSSYKYFDTRIADSILAIIQKLDPDIIHVSHVAMSQYIPTKGKRRVHVLELENIETQLQFSRLPYTRPFLKQVHIFFEAIISYVYETRTFRLYDHIFTICDEDRSFLNRFFRHKHVSTLAMSMPLIRKKKTVHHAPKILFVGTTGWPPNQDALNWFLDTIFPTIMKKLPHAEFHIVGRIYAPHKKKWSRTPNVFFHGKKNDVSAFVAEAGVFVLPFRIGGGVKVKALTAFMSGVPVVTTPVGVRGYRVMHNRECLIANSPNEFARYVIELLEDTTLARVLTQNARSYASAFHGRKVYEHFLVQYHSLRL